MILTRLLTVVSFRLFGEFRLVYIFFPFGHDGGDELLLTRDTDGWPTEVAAAAAAADDNV